MVLIICKNLNTRIRHRASWFESMRMQKGEATHETGRRCAHVATTMRQHVVLRVCRNSLGAMLRWSGWAHETPLSRHSNLPHEARMQSQLLRAANESTGSGCLLCLEVHDQPNCDHRSDAEYCDRRWVPKIFTTVLTHTLEVEHVFHALGALEARVSIFACKLRPAFTLAEVA